MKKLNALIVLLFAAFSVFSQTEVEKGLEAITLDAVKGQLDFLASDWTEGRAVGTKGEYIAGDYIASMFKVYGIQPFGDKEMNMPSRRSMMGRFRPEVTTSYFQNFSLLDYTPGEEQSFSVVTTAAGSENSVDFGYRSDFYVRTGTVGQTVKAPLAFIGYGFTSEDKSYDDLKKMDLKGKIVVMLSGYPGYKDSTSAAYKKFTPTERFAMYRMERDKTTNLEKSGILGIIQVNPDSDPSLSWAQNHIYPVKGNYYEADQPLGSYYDNRMALPGDSLTSNVPVFTVTPRVANEIIGGTGINFKEFEKVAAEKMLSASQNLAGKSVAFKTTVHSKVVKVRNVVGYIEGENKDEYIVVGGHYDHLGKFDGWIWNGADDNASGTVGVMTIAKACMATGKKPAKSIIFAAWTGEEKGLYGSKYFVLDAIKKKMNVELNLNYDMISRDTERDSLKNQAIMTYTKANPELEETSKKYITDYNLNLNVDYRSAEKPGGGSDHASFADAGIPVYYFEAAMHPDYHQPSDEISKINWEKMANIIRVGFLNIWDFANSDEYLKKE